MRNDILINNDNRVSEDFVPLNLIEVPPKIKGSVDPDRKILLVDECYEAFSKMREDAKNYGISIEISSGYRSYAYQKKVWDHYLELIGLEKTEERVAIPGASDHHSGLALDWFSFRHNEDGSIFPYTGIKEDDIEYLWVRDNGYRYGFIIRFPKGKTSITNVMFEPWHIRYVGKDAAKKIYEEGLTLEEYHEKVKVR